MHTPGPWQEWNLFGSRTMKNWRVGSKASPGITTPVAVVDDSIPSDEQVANARLIAASPELLESVAALVNVLERWPGKENPEFFPEVKAARALLERLNID